MAKKSNIETEPQKTESLDEIVERYGRLKQEVDSYEKQIKSDNSSIKSKMTEMDLKEYESKNYIAKYAVSVSESFDEEKLVEKLRSMMVEVIEDGLPVKKSMAEALDLIEYKPAVKMEALENAIYNGKISAADLADCVLRKETGRLTIKAKDKE